MFPLHQIAHVGVRLRGLVRMLEERFITVSRKNLLAAHHRITSVVPEREWGWHIVRLPERNRCLYLDEMLAKNYSPPQQSQEL